MPSGLLRSGLVGVAIAAVGGVSASARAAEVDLAGKPLEVDVTNTAIIDTHFNNHNDLPNTPGTKLDDHYQEFLDRFNLNLSWWRFNAGVRLDSYVASQFSTTDIAKLVALEASTAAFAKGRGIDPLILTSEYDAELNTRYIDTLYPAKLFVGYQQPSIEATAGDFYVQLGRGLVFSVRKIDELSIDTTVRGAKIAADKDFGPLHLGALAFAGQLNPLRIDETSGRRLNGTSDPLFFGFPQGQTLVTTQLNGNGTAITVDDAARPNYLEDGVFGGKIEGGPKEVIFGIYGVSVQRQHNELGYLGCIANRQDQMAVGSVVTQGICEQRFPDFVPTDPSRDHDTNRNFSGSMNVPSLGGHGDLYVEVAGQQLRDGAVTALASNTTPESKIADESGYAVYAAASFREGPLTVSLEGKHYRRFFPIAANIDIGTSTGGFAAPEFNNIAYSSPPTAQSIYIQPVSAAAPNVCVTGGRANVTYRFNPRTAVFMWLGRFASWSELVATNNDCATEQGGSSLETDTWDYAAGTEIFLEQGKSKINVYMGALEIDTKDPQLAGASSLITNTFYREGYMRYDIVKHIAGPFSVQAQGWHRRRYEPFTYAAAWWEGENYTALQWSPHVSAIMGFEYQLQDGCQPGDLISPGRTGQPKNTCYFFNGGGQWRSAGMGGAVGQVFDTVNLFVGDRRGALRCVSGVCRVFPPFSGARLELVSRF